MDTSDIKALQVQLRDQVRRVVVGQEEATGLVLTAKLGRSARGVLSGFLQEAGVTVIPFGEQHWRASVEAYTRFGKGRHAAGLNFGDCLAYATARMAGQPLLCIGDDFARTDLVLA